MAKKPSEENDRTQPKERGDLSLDEPLLEDPLEGELEPTESSALEGDIVQEESPEQTRDDFEEVTGEADSAVEDALDGGPEEPQDGLGEEPDEALDEEPGIESDGTLVEAVDEEIDEKPDEEPVAKSEPTITVEPSPYFPRGIYEDAWSVEAYYGRERPSDMDHTQDHKPNRLAFAGKKRLRILLVALALLLVLALVFLAVTGRIYLPF